MRLCLVINVLLCFLMGTSSKRGQRVLNDYIRHYEELNYDVTKLHNQHLRAKRSIDKSLELKFSAFGKQFHLDLWPSNSVFAHDHKSRQSDGTESHVDTSFIYDGEVRGVPGSRVHGAVLDGQFQGLVVNSQEEIYFIEPASRYFRGSAPHTIIYREDHMNLDPYRHKRAADGHHGSCGLDKYQNWMMSQSEAANDKSSALHDDVIKDNFYSKDSHSAFSRHKRAGCYNRPTTCDLYLRADPVLFNETMRRLGNSVAANNEILALFSSHVFAINNIFKSTRFQTFPRDSACFVGMNFRIKKTTIMTDESLQCTPDLRTTALSFCNPNIEVSNFLNLNSMENHDEFCLAYVFTYRDFSGGTLGLAWIGSPSAALGGVCERYRSIREGERTVQKSLNTGIATLLNYGQRVPPRVSQLSFAHDVGHNFGSPHDSGSVCTPGGDAGNYIMYQSPVSGNHPNNHLFSPCSKESITRVLYAVVNRLYGKTNCFTSSDEAFCGNGIVEEGEECDCGYTEDCQDNCCHPRDNRLSAAADTLKCTLKIVNGAKVQCSPSQGPCCSTACSFLPSTGHVCRPATDCTKAGLCDGGSATCPPVQKEPDMTYCNQHLQVCTDGVCQGSLCKRIGYNDTVADSFTPSWDECYITGGSDVKSRERMCFLACQKGQNGICQASDEDGLSGDFRKLIDDVKKKQNLGVNQIKVAPGTPCNGYRGYCDVYHRCRGVDNDAPVEPQKNDSSTERPKDPTYGEATSSSIKNWIIKHWWAVLLIAVGVVILMGLLIKVISNRTSSKDPKLKKQRKRTKIKNSPKKKPPLKNPGPYYISGRGGGGGADGRDHHYNPHYNPNYNPNYHRRYMETRRV